MTIKEFQAHIRERYGTRDAERGIWPTFGWFMEEVGELASAMHDTDQKNKEEEFADVFAWLCTLANINGIDLHQAIQDKYFKNCGPQGHK